MEVQIGLRIYPPRAGHGICCDTITNLVSQQQNFSEIYCIVNEIPVIDMKNTEPLKRGLFDFMYFPFLFHPVDPQGIYHIGRSTGNSNLVMTSSAGGAKGCSDHRLHAPPVYTAQFQHRANNRYMANHIWLTLRVSSSTRVTLEQSPIRVLTEFNVA